MLEEIYQDIDELEGRTSDGTQFFALSIEIPTRNYSMVIRISYAQILSLLLNENAEGLEIGIAFGVPHRKQMVKIKNTLLPLLSGRFKEVPQSQCVLLLKNYNRDFASLKTDLKKIIEAFSPDSSFTYHLTYSAPPMSTLE